LKQDRQILSEISCFYEEIDFSEPTDLRSAKFKTKNQHTDFVHLMKFSAMKIPAFAKRQNVRKAAKRFVPAGSPERDPAAIPSLAAPPPFLF
jgi:hypothetical protein